MKAASPAYQARMTANQSLEDSGVIAKLKSQLQDQLGKTAREKSRPYGLKKERDEARLTQESLKQEISALTLRYEEEFKKCKVLQCNMQDDPGKTEAVDKQLRLKDEAYKALQQPLGDCLAENAELRSGQGHIQETAGWEVRSLERKLAKEQEMNLDIAKSRDSYLKFNQDVLNMCKGQVNDRDWAEKVDEQRIIAQEDNRILRLHLKNSLGGEEDLKRQVLQGMSEVGQAQRAAREKDRMIDELNNENRQSEMELKQLKLQACEYEDVFNAKDHELRRANQNTCFQVSNVAARLYAVIDHGSKALIQEKQRELHHLQKVFMQYSQTNQQLEQRLYFLEETHKWDTDSARKAQAVHEADTSRMIAAEEQVVQLIASFSSGEHVTNTGSWNQWRECDAARIEARQVLEKAVGRFEDVRCLALDVFNFMGTLCAFFGLDPTPGTYHVDHHERLIRRATQILEVTETEKHRPKIFYAQPIPNANQKLHSARRNQKAGNIS